MIRLQAVSKHYPLPTGRHVALREIDLQIEAAEIFGIIGASGAGKSTLVRLINLLERPTGGEIFVRGQPVSGVSGAELRALRRSIGMVFQHFNLLAARTVAENVAFPLELAGEGTREERRARVAELLGRVGLTAHADKYPRQLSGGQKQRVGIARALATRPDILLCDEATSALDPETTRSVLALLQEINADLGLTIVLITHEMDVVRQACDRVAVLDGGQVCELGPVADVFLRPRHPATLRLVREAEDGGDDNAAGEDVYRLTFVGASAHRPLLGAVARDHGVDYGIVAGRIGHIRQTPYAQITVALSGNDVPGALAAFARHGVAVDAIGAGGEAGHA